MSNPAKPAVPTPPLNSHPKILIIGAGPSGMMAAIRAAALGASVTLIEKNRSAGRKLSLTGKGRCNITNAGDIGQILQRFGRHGQFLRDALKKFSNTDLMNFFRSYGLQLTVERQERVFPENGKAGSVSDLLVHILEQHGVNILFDKRFHDLVLEDSSVKGIKLKDNSFLPADKVIFAAGGVSYPFTGSSGDWIEPVKKAGHSVTPLLPALVPLETEQDFPALLQGLTLKNIRLEFHIGKTKQESPIGELLFTSFGISGPLVLTASGDVSEGLSKKDKVFVLLDLKPALSQKQLDERIQRDIKANPRKQVLSLLSGLMPLSMSKVFAGICALNAQKQCAQITRQERQAVIDSLKGLRMDIKRTRPIEEAMVTRGGVSLKEIYPRTMASRLVQGLYFCGEMIDIDADTGGFNLQAAFSTGFLAGESAAGAV